MAPPPYASTVLLAKSPAVRVVASALPQAQLICSTSTSRGSPAQQLAPRSLAHLSTSSMPTNIRVDAPVSYASNISCLVIHIMEILAMQFHSAGRIMSTRGSTCEVTFQRPELMLHDLTLTTRMFSFHGPSEITLRPRRIGSRSSAVDATNPQNNPSLSNTEKTGQGPYTYHPSPQQGCCNWLAGVSIMGRLRSYHAGRPIQAHPECVSRL